MAMRVPVSQTGVPGTRYSRVPGGGCAGRAACAVLGAVGSRAGARAGDSWNPPAAPGCQTCHSAKANAAEGAPGSLRYLVVPLPRQPRWVRKGAVG